MTTAFGPSIYPPFPAPGAAHMDRDTKDGTKAMDSNLTVNACIGIRDGCEMKYLVNVDGQIEFSFGSTRYPFELVFDAPALRHFVELAANGLERVAASVIQEDSDAGRCDEQA